MDRFDKGPEPKDGTLEAEGPSLDEAVDSLFVQSFEELGASTTITSGDEETDRAIDLAVDNRRASPRRLRSSRRRWSNPESGLSLQLPLMKS